MTQWTGGARFRSTRTLRDLVARLIIDECLSSRLATELRGRGYDAVSVADLGHAGLHDPDLLDELHGNLEDWVLVTGDDAMPADHHHLIRDYHHTTIATVDSEWQKMAATHTQEQFKRDTVHRWAHVMAAQATGEVRRYSPVRNATWTWRVRKYGPNPEN